MPPCHKQTDRRSGFTLLETAISIVVMGLLLSSVFSVTVETSHFLGDNETNSVMQAEGNRALERLTDILRKTGRTELAGVAYPRVTAGGSTLQFLMLTDVDGNGYAYEENTSRLEWRPKVYSIKTDADGNLDVYDGLNKVYFLGRFIQGLTFRTIDEDPTLHLKEIRVRFDVNRTTPTGVDLSYNVSSSIHMRN